MNVKKQLLATKVGEEFKPAGTRWRVLYLRKLNVTDEVFTWPESPPQEWWEQAGADCRCTEQQIKFAAARLAGNSATQAAKLAGYAGKLRVAGYTALRSAGVARLLQLAEAERV